MPPFYPIFACVDPGSSWIRIQYGSGSGSTTLLAIKLVSLMPLNFLGNLANPKKYVCLVLHFKLNCLGWGCGGWSWCPQCGCECGQSQPLSSRPHGSKNRGWDKVTKLNRANLCPLDLMVLRTEAETRSSLEPICFLRVTCNWKRFSTLLLRLYTFLTILFSTRTLLLILRFFSNFNSRMSVVSAFW